MPSDEMGKCANKSTQLDIDHEILDYLLYKAIKALLARDRTMERKDNGIVKKIDGHSLCLQMVDCTSFLPCRCCSGSSHHLTAFLGIFRSIHPNQPAPTDIQFRLRLLRFTSMFTARFALTSIEPPPTRLPRMRWQNKESTNEFNQTFNPWQLGELGVMDREASKRNKAQKPQSPYPASGEISLLDTLPSFMALSAAQSMLQDRPITDIWMRLAAGFMAHAALEQYLVYGVPLSDAIRAAFAWGFDAESTAQEGSEEWQINAMFLGEDEEVLGWSEIKNEHMQAVSFQCPDAR